MAEESKKITADQLAIVREITRKRDRLIYDLGLNEFNSLKLESEKSEIKKVLFVSSTSVYRDVFPIEEITEETPTNPETESGKQLVEVEQLLLNNPYFQTIVLRFGGLIGEDRHPIKYLAGKENVENPDGPINFIHQEDCIGIILEILEQVLQINRGNHKILKQVQHKNIVFNAECFHVSRFRLLQVSGH